MTDPLMEKASPLPVWIYKRDGRLVPFEADKISQSLFAAGETSGRPDAFTARELTDSILHFLCAELNGAIPHTSQVADITFKVVRELGQSSIAQAFEDYSRNIAPGKESTKKPKRIHSHDKESGRKRWPKLPTPSVLAAVDPHSLIRNVAAISLEDYSLREIFTRDIVAAHKEGLITLSGLATPFQMQGGILTAISPGQLTHALEDFRASVGQVIALDGTEYSENDPVANASGPAHPGSPHHWVRELLFGLRATGLHAMVNLNVATPPSWALSLAPGPLFEPSPALRSIESRAARAVELLELLCSQSNAGVQVHWHINEADCHPINESRLARLVRYLLHGGPITIVFDRPNRPISLAEGLDRRHASLLISVGIHLPGLIRQLGEKSTPELFLKKLGSLARLAITAAVQKRRFLNRYQRARTSFLVDRARLVVIPVGLEFVAKNFTEENRTPGPSGAECSPRIIRSLSEILREEGPRYNLESVLDSPPNAAVWPVLGQGSPFNLIDAGCSSPNLETIAGLTGWNEAISPRDQLQIAGAIHAITETGTAWLRLSREDLTKIKDLIWILRFAWKETQVHRLRISMMEPGERQLIPSWEETEEIT